jgi:hypothetical protein
MKYLKYSGYYIATYAITSGIMFFFWPKFFLHLLFSNTEYVSYEPWRLVGVICWLIVVLVIQIIRIESVEMFKATLVGRLTAIPFVFYLFFHTKDPVYLSFGTVMGIGVLSTILAFYLRSKDMKSLQQKS